MDLPKVLRGPTDPLQVLSEWWSVGFVASRRGAICRVLAGIAGAGTRSTICVAVHRPGRVCLREDRRPLGREPTQPGRTTSSAGNRGYRLVDRNGSATADCDCSGSPVRRAGVVPPPGPTPGRLA